jgi:hypothetical protein
MPYKRQMLISRVKSKQELLNKLLQPLLMDSELIHNDLIQSEDDYNTYVDKFQVFWTQLHTFNSRQPASSYNVMMTCVEKFLYLQAD